MHTRSRTLVALLGLRHTIPLVNALADGTHESGLTKKCDAVLSAANLLVKTGTDADHVAVTAAVTDIPLGPIEAPTDAIEDTVGVRLLGKGSTKLGVASGAIAVGDRLTPAAAGAVAAYTSGAACFIGRALTAAADGEPVEYADCHPFTIAA
jgi:hypothetical protein